MSSSAQTDARRAGIVGVDDQRWSRPRKEAPMTTRTNQRRRHPAHGSALAAAGLTLGLGLTGCTADIHPVASSTGTSTATTTAAGGTRTATAAATTTTGPERDIVLAGRHFRARCDGSGPPVIAVA